MHSKTSRNEFSPLLFRKSDLHYVQFSCSNRFTRHANETSARRMHTSAWRANNNKIYHYLSSLAFAYALSHSHHIPIWTISIRQRDFFSVAAYAERPRTPVIFVCVFALLSSRNTKQKRIVWVCCWFSLSNSDGHSILVGYWISIVLYLSATGLFVHRHFLLRFNCCIDYRLFFSFVGFSLSAWFDLFLVFFGLLNHAPINFCTETMHKTHKTHSLTLFWMAHRHTHMHHSHCLSLVDHIFHIRWPIGFLLFRFQFLLGSVWINSGSFVLFGGFLFCASARLYLFWL